MKRNTVTALFVAMSAVLLSGCLTTTSGTASCDGGGEMCWVNRAAATGANAEVFFKGPACDEVCRVASDCDGRVQVTVKHAPVDGADKVVNVLPNNVSAQCLGAALPESG